MTRQSLKFGKIRTNQVANMLFRPLLKGVPFNICTLKYQGSKNSVFRHKILLSDIKRISK